MDWDTFAGLPDKDQKKAYEKLLDQLNELKNKSEILRMEKTNLEEENKKLFELNVNSLPVEKKMEVDERLANMGEEIRKQKAFIDNFHKTLDEKEREKMKIETQLTDEVSRYYYKINIFSL